MSDLVTLDRFVFFPDAEIARATLEAAGIDAVLITDSSKPTEGVMLRVHADDVDEAREILNAPMEVVPEAAEPLQDEEHCPRCFGIEIYPVSTRAKRLATILLFALATVFGFHVAVLLLAFGGHEVSEKLENAVLSLVLITSAFAFLYSAIAPKKRCRNCGLEWRGTQRPS